ncbi:hypothetical protein [Geobacillus thermopakistaniensis]|uniref:hypothetical protein n=1 Tax=Geobacillus thermopakistaniensis (strain MAS1) TaxID=1408282 RepID=UPI003D199D86
MGCQRLKLIKSKNGMGRKEIKKGEGARVPICHSPIFHFIAAKSTEAGLHLCDGYAKQTVQLWMKDPAVETGKRRIGAIQ